MSEKKDRELSEKELKKAAGGGQPFGTPQRKDSKTPYGDAGKKGGEAFGDKRSTPYDDKGTGKGKR